MFHKTVKRNFLLQRISFLLYPMAVPVYWLDVVSGSRQRTTMYRCTHLPGHASEQSHTSAFSRQVLKWSFCDLSKLFLLWHRVDTCSLYDNVRNRDCDEPTGREFFFPFCPVVWLVASTPRCCVGHLLYSIFNHGGFGGWSSCPKICGCSTKAASSQGFRGFCRSCLTFFNALWWVMLILLRLFPRD